MIPEISNAKNISSHQDIWIIFTYLFGQSNDCIMMPKIIAISNKKASYPSRMRFRIISEFLKVKKKKKKKKNIKKVI